MSANGTGARHSNAVHQAEGVVSVQAECTVDEAHLKIQTRATSLGLSLEDTAVEILAHRIWFNR